MRFSRALSFLAVVGLLAPSLPLHAELPPAGPRNAPISEDARKDFKIGVDFLNDPDGGRYEEAFRAFNEAYKLSPSWKILGNLGLCAMKLERNGDAIEAYERYLSQGATDIDAGERAQIEKDLRLLKEGSAPLTVTSDADGTVVDQRVRANGTTAVNIYTVKAGQPLALMVASGHHVVTAKSSSTELKWETDLAAKVPAKKDFSFKQAAAAPAASAAPVASSAPAPPTSTPPSEAPSSTLRTVGMVTAGVGGALLLGGAVTGLMAGSKSSKLEDDCPNKTCTTDKQGDIDSLRSLQSTTTILLIGGGVLTAAGVTMFFLGAPKTESATAKRIDVVPSVGPGGGGLFASGRF
jgi:hypothetical protein